MRLGESASAAHSQRRVQPPFEGYGNVGLCERYSDSAELRADPAAVRTSAGREAPLASALLMFDEVGPPGVTGISPEARRLAARRASQMAAAAIAPGRVDCPLGGHRSADLGRQRDRVRPRHVEPAASLLPAVRDHGDDSAVHWVSGAARSVGREDKEPSSPPLSGGITPPPSLAQHGCQTRPPRPSPAATSGANRIHSECRTRRSGPESGSEMPPRTSLSRRSRLSDVASRLPRTSVIRGAPLYWVSRRWSWSVVRASLLSLSIL